MAKDMDKTPALAVLLGIGKKKDEEKEPKKVELSEDESTDDKDELEMVCEAIIAAIAKKNASSLKEAMLSFIEKADMEECSTADEDKE